jgi:hypothetical protein
VQVDVLGRADQHPVAVPPRLPQDQPVPEAFQGGQITGLLRRVPDGQVDVDDRLGRQARHRGRPDVLDADDLITQSLAKARAGGGELARPGRVVVLNDNGLPFRGRLPDQGGRHLLGGAVEALHNFR